MARSRGARPDSPPLEPISVPASGVLAVYGYGIQLRVQDGHLVVTYLDLERRRSARFNRATAGLKRVVILGPTGSVSLDALRWLREVGVGLVVLNRDGELVAAQGACQLDHVRLRRAQALAPLTPGGLKIMRGLLQAKFDGQLRNLARLRAPDGVQAAIELARVDLDDVHSAEELMQLEGAAADLYWQAWEELPAHFPRASRAGVPEHWRRFGVRKSPIGRLGSPNQAITPGNALANFLYALLEAEARLACVALDLDPGLGVLHADHRYRDSLALDLMEPVRPAVDAYLLELLTTTFRPRDFLETREGVCRIGSRLTTTLVQTMARWRVLVAPVAERTAQALCDLGAALSGEGAREKLPTPLTGASRRRRRVRVPAAPLPPGTCRDCGAALDAPDRRCCDDCVLGQRAVELPAAGLNSLTALRAQGIDPSHGGQAAIKRARTMARHNRLLKRWDEDHNGPRPAPDEFLREVQPGLRAFTVTRIARATGLSRTYCEFIRRGVAVPHPMHWPALRALVSQ